MVYMNIPGILGGLALQLNAAASRVGPHRPHTQPHTLEKRFLTNGNAGQHMPSNAFQTSAAPNPT